MGCAFHQTQGPLVRSTFSSRCCVAVGAIDQRSRGVTSRSVGAARSCATIGPFDRALPVNRAGDADGECSPSIGMVG